MADAPYQAAVDEGRPTREFVDEKVVMFKDAEAALAIAMQQPLALITLDIMLPNMDGWEFLNRLKQIPDIRRIPVVIISQRMPVLRIPASIGPRLVPTSVGST